MKKGTAAKAVLVYSTPTCHFCKLAKEFMTENGVAYIDYDVQNDLEKRQEMVEKSSQMAVPVIDVEGEILVGFSEERLRAALENAGFLE